MISRTVITEITIIALFNFLAKYSLGDKIAKIKQDKLNSTSSPFMHECPFLINNECSVYKYRGIICRTFGLLSSKDDETPKVPFCAYEGLNYSNVLDTSINIISEEKFNKLIEEIFSVRSFKLYILDKFGSGRFDTFIKRYKNGEIIYSGGKEIITTELIRDIFDIATEIAEIEGKKLVIRKGRK